MKHTGAPAYDAVLKLFENPKTPSMKVAAMYALSTSFARAGPSHLADYDVLISRGLTNTVDPALQARTFDMILSSVRNQDLIYFFRGLCTNTAALNALREFFETNYHSVGASSMCPG